MSDEQIQRPTSAAEMRRKNAEAPKATTLVTMEGTGNVWELCIPDVMGYVMTGRMPQSLVNEFLDSMEERGLKPKDAKKKIEEAAAGLSGKDISSALIFMRELVREACVNPRIVVGATADDEIDPTEVNPKDFKEIFQWVLLHSGVAGIEGLRNFRKGRERRTSRGKPNGAKLRNETVGSSRNK